MKILIILLFFTNFVFAQENKPKRLIEYRELINDDSTYARSEIRKVNINFPGINGDEDLVIVYIWNIYFYPTYYIPTRENTTSYRVFEAASGQVFSFWRKLTDDEINELQK